MIVLQDAHDFFGLGGLGEGREPAEVAKQHGDATAVAFQQVLVVARREDKLDDLRREQSLQSADAFDLADLLGDPPLEGLIPGRKLRRLLLRPIMERLDAQHFTRATNAT